MRYPAVAGRFYPIGKNELIESIESCFSSPLGPGFPGTCVNDRRISAAICPHAGYSASGSNAAHSFKAIAEDGLPEAYVVIGPDHYGVPFDVVMCSDDYLTPLGPCKVHKEIASKLRELIPDNANAHSREHSIEVEIPFLQYIDPDPRIVPIIMGNQDYRSAERLAECIKYACEGKDVVIIASSDLAHYVPKSVATELNGRVLDKIGKMDIRGMYSNISREHITVCGYGPIATAMMASDPSHVEVLKYSDSWDSLRYDADSVVGYGSAVMYK